MSSWNPIGDYPAGVILQKVIPQEAMLWKVVLEEVVPWKVIPQEVILQEVILGAGGYPMAGHSKGGQVDNYI